MSLRTKLVSTLVSLTIAAGAITATAQPSAAHHLSPGEAAAIAGIGGFIIGSAIANSRRDRYPDHRRMSSWERHVQRCYDRYRTYDHETDTYVGYDGYEHLCRL